MKHLFEWKKSWFTFDMESSVGFKAAVTSWLIGMAQAELETRANSFDKELKE